MYCFNFYLYTFVPWKIEQTFNAYIFFFFNFVDLLNINKQDHQYKINCNIFVLILVLVSGCNQELHHIKIVLQH